MADVLGKKISELAETTDLAGLYTIGSDRNNQSKKVPLQFVKEAADYANAQGDYAKGVGDTIQGNTGVNEYPAFSSSTQYAAGSVVRYNNKLYRFTALHPAGAWVGTDAIETSIKAETDVKLTELESYYLQESDLLNGYWTASTGVFEMSDAFVATIKMPCSGKSIKVLLEGKPVNSRVLFWDKDGIFLNSFVISNKAINVPENASLFAVNICIDNKEFPQYITYSVEEVKKMSVAGVLRIINTIVEQAETINQQDRVISELQTSARANTPTFNELGYEFGYYDSVGHWFNSELFVATEYIGVAKGDKLYIHSDYNNLNARIILFGVAKNYIQRGLINENGFVIPDDIYYVRFVFDIGDNTTGLTVISVEDFKTMYASGFNLFARIQKNEQEIEKIKEQDTGVPCLFNVPINFHKDNLRILDIGNSYTQDCHTYIADILNSYGYNEGYSLYSAIRGSGSFKSWVDQYNNQDNREYNIYHVAGESLGIEGSGTPYNGQLFRNALKEKWDVILIHTYSGYSTQFEQWQGTTEAGYLNELLQILKETNPQATIGFLSVHSYKSGYSGNAEGSSLARWENIVRAAKQIKSVYDIDFIIPYGTAIQNLRNVISNDDEFTEDGTHLAKGLADYTASCCYYQSLFAPRFGKSILGNTFRTTGLSGVGVVNVTDDNAPIAQKAALLATCNMWAVTM